MFFGPELKEIQLISLNQLYLLQFWSKKYVFGLIWKLTGMAFKTLTRTRTYPSRLPAQVCIPLSFTICFGMMKQMQLFTPQAIREADMLIDIIADEGLEMALPRGILTLKHMVTNLHSHPDNVWCSPELIPLIIWCDVDSYLQPPCTDHFPIITIINIPQDRIEPKISFNFGWLIGMPSGNDSS